HRLTLRADNAADRLTPLARDLGLLARSALGRLREQRFAERAAELAAIHRLIDDVRIDLAPLADLIRRPDFSSRDLERALSSSAPAQRFSRSAILTAHTDRFYAAYIDRQHAEVRRHAETERRRIPPTLDYATIPSLRTEARLALQRFRPETIGQAARLEGITPADVTLLAVLVRRENERGRGRDAYPASIG
ncbi:MAG: tRNA uridine-5-carboxymethylaminomethyl(34) synthesis enzyme MnmG, partial [Phycisphaerales bacterium]